MNAGESVQLAVSGGDGNYTWAATRGALSALSGTQTGYTAPAGTGLHTVTVRDGPGQQREIPILRGKR